MSRLDEIRARLEAAMPGQRTPDQTAPIHYDWDAAESAFIAHAPDDIRYMLNRLEQAEAVMKLVLPLLKEAEELAAEIRAEAL